ncbi:MAG: tetratricopeptide repeat protein [Actinomycetota bacterium]|nr:tetratricopeptide repeat protein [Actinomycetota bacterium]
MELAPMPVLPAVHRTIVAVDVEGFGERINSQQVAVRGALYDVLRQAFHAAGIPWSGCHSEDRGDGVLIVAPPEVAKSVFVESLPVRLVEGLREYNSTHPAAEQIRLRMALHAGELHYDEHGVAGASVNLTFRLLNADPLRSALAGSPGVLALITSYSFFEEIVRHSPDAHPTAYRPVRVVAKETDTVGWVHLPDHPYPARDSTVADPLLGALSRMVPHQLPADTTHFVGRAAELRLLSKVMDTATADGGTVVISAVLGTPGVGKSALALRWAHQVRDGFPDGQLYVNLRGYDPDQPLSAADALARFLRALGVAGTEIPPELDERAALYRSLLDGRRILVVLDNASAVEQLRPLLPGTASCVVVVTSRDSLAGLVARHGAVRVDLDLLPLQDAIALLGVLIGQRVRAEPEAAAALAEQCARLPLALRVAAELAVTRPATSLTELVAELADEQRRLELLDAGGDPRTAVRAVFSWSYHHLPAKAARAFRLLGLHPGPDLDPFAAATLTDTSLEQAQHLLDLLARAHLVQRASPSRYGMHDLLRAYATHLAGVEDSEAQRRTALTRLFDHYLATAAAAMDALVPAETHRRPRPGSPATPSPPVADPAAARTWLDAERSTLTAVCAHTAAHGWPGHTTGLATTLFRYLEGAGHYPDALTISTHALHAARDAGDQTGEAHALSNLGAIYGRQGRYQQAAEHLHQSLALFCKIGDRAGEARAVGNLGAVYQRQGRYQQATEQHQQALTLAREIGHRVGEAYALDHLGTVLQRLGRHHHAAEQHQRALALFRKIGDRAGEAYALTNLGDVYQRQGHYEQAAEHHQQAIALFRETGHQAGEVEALNSVGETHYAAGHHDQAHAHHTAALTLATQISDRYELARAHNGLAHIHHATGELDQARDHWHEALALYTNLGVPDADEVRAHLTALNQAASAHREC